MRFDQFLVGHRAPAISLTRALVIGMVTALTVLFMPATAFAVPGAPAAPAQPTVTRGNGQISVAFVAPADNGSTILFYTASCVSSTAGAPGSISDIGSPLVVVGLDNGETYTCTVTATNAVGEGPASPASASTVPAGVPTSPFAPIVTRGNAQISVAITPRSNNGSAITGYTATCTSSNGGASGSLGGPASPLVVTGLTNGKIYTCTVIATNAVGDSAVSAASSATVPATVPDAPAQPTVTAGNAQITVAFVAPVGNGGATVTGNTATCTSSDGGAGGNNSGATSPIVVSALTNAKTYTCTVHATNGVGNSLESTASAPAVPATVPAQPAAPTLTRGNAQISVAFVAPADNGSAITGYTAACDSSDGGASGSNSGASSPIVVSSLTNGKTYTCTVLATNALGNSAVSSDSATAVPATVPGTPAAPVVTHGDTTISVAFSPPGSNGGSAITGYTTACTSSDGGASGSNSGGSSPIVVSGLTNGKTYTCTVLATNATGGGLASADSASTIPATVPDAPATPTVTRGNLSISVAFLAPADGGNAISGYTATCTSSDGGATGVQGGASSPIVVPALTNGKTYTCTVLASNAEGDGSDSGASATVVPAAVPSTPAAPTLTHGNASISVAFVAPAANGSSITGYSVTCVSSDGGSAGSNTQNATTIVVSLLTNGKTYTCSVIATNAVGDSLASADSSSTIPATTPSAPAAPTVTRGAGSISVAFVAPATGGNAISGYTATCTSSDGGATGNNTGATSPIVVSALTNGNTYTCTVRATNDEGDSAESVASASVVPATVPSAPAKPTTIAGVTSMSVSFVAPATGGSAITGYTASCTSSDGGTAGSASGGSSPISVSGLSKGKSYTCTVSATNAVGDGADSVASDAMVIPATAPNTPTAPTVTRGNLSISVAFVVPADGGSAITGYTATCTSSDGGALGSNSGASSPIVVSSLTNGKTYTCTVLATNGVGPSGTSLGSVTAVPATVPSAPAMPTLVRGNLRLVVTYAAPGSTGGSAVTGSTATCTSSDGGVTGTASSASSPVTVTGLTNGKSYTCTVHATNAVGSGAESVASVSELPGVVPENSVAPTITGRAANHLTLTAHDGTWRAGPPPRMTRQWQRCNLRVTSCVSIPGAVGHTYVMRNADLFHKMRVIVTGTNVLGSLAVTSSVTARVAAR